MGEISSGNSGEIHLDGDPDEFINFGDIARQYLNQQCQYASWYVGGFRNTPDLSGGLKFEGDPDEYHSLKIRRGDVAEFINRVQEYRRQSGLGESSMSSFLSSISKQEQEEPPQPQSHLENAPRDASIFADEEILELLKERNIDHEDLDVIAALAGVDKNELIGQYHNFFAWHFDAEDPTKSAVKAIEHSITDHQQALERAKVMDSTDAQQLFNQRLILDEAILYLTKAYGPRTANAITRWLERRKQN